MLLPIFPSVRHMGMVGEACLPSNTYYPRTPDYTLYSGVHVCWSEHSDSSFVYRFMSLDYGLGTMTAITVPVRLPVLFEMIDLIIFVRIFVFISAVIIRLPNLLFGTKTTIGLLKT